MRKQFLLTYALLSLLAFTEPASAKQAIKAQAVEAELPDVIVGAGERSEAISYQAIIKGLEAFAGHGHLAPRATPRFILQPQQQDANLKGVTLVLATADRDINIAIDKNGVFTAPRVDARESLDARILLNRPDGAFALKPFVRTPGLPPNTRRLGDFRAICEMRWAIERDDGSIPFPTRLVAEGIGTPCRSWLVKVIFREPRPIAEVWLVSGQRREALAQERIRQDRTSFSPPLHDDSWPDDTLIELKFVEAADP
ncbi:hypothetical protein FM996_20240 [Methylosinus sporium]|uniref:Uncharacterized protein n=1 Tax=Methylosinus sporium TaxID=428 RepID=A0A549SD59_METSR|nr:hypothetical protein [Methylosinus sporium]TRL24687.1 hypothetical protein FM996_20240 [Methylosinus sporium]